MREENKRRESWMMRVVDDRKECLCVRTREKSKQWNLQSHDETHVRGEPCVQAFLTRVTSRSTEQASKHGKADLVLFGRHNPHQNGCQRECRILAKQLELQRAGHQLIEEQEAQIV